MADLKEFAEQLVSLSVKEVNELAQEVCAKRQLRIQTVARKGSRRW